MFALGGLVTSQRTLSSTWTLAYVVMALRCLVLGRPAGFFVFYPLFGFKRIIFKNIFQRVLGAILVFYSPEVEFHAGRNCRRDKPWTLSPKKSRRCKRDKPQSLIPRH